MRAFQVWQQRRLSLFVLASFGAKFPRRPTRQSRSWVYGISTGPSRPPASHVYPKNGRIKRFRPLSRPIVVKLGKIGRQSPLSLRQEERQTAALAVAISPRRGRGLPSAKPRPPQLNRAHSPCANARADGGHNFAKMSDLKLESTAAVNIGVGKGLFMLSGRRCSERTAMAPSSNQGKAHFSRRRHTSFSAGESGFKRRKKDGGIVPPTKFLLGGNINDPLNLNSLSDEVNQVTPQTSPMPTPKHRIQVQVLIPPNINDPLNLNADDDAELQLMSPKAPKRKHRKKKKHASRHGTEPPLTSATATTTSVEEPPVPHVAEQLDSTAASVPSTAKDAHCSPPRTLKLDPGPPLPDGCPGAEDSGKPQGNRGGRRSDDKIVSPVIPQPGMVRKRGNSGMSLSESSDKSYKKGKGHVVVASATPIPTKPRFREKDAKYRYGNYNRYYGYRNPSAEGDVRLQCFRREWFEGLDVLDVGCNVGHLTLTVASEMAPRKIIGIDIDANLIRSAKMNVRHYMREKDTPQVSHDDFPISFALCHGPIVAPVASVLARSHESNFPNNVFFVEGNYVLECDELLEMQKPAYDTILCLSLTKWVHLNWGDEGLKRLFKRMYKQLRPGGRMILEAQAMSSYVRKKKLTETIFHNYNTIRLLPDRFTEYLLSQEVGFTKCEVVDVPMNPSRGFRRPIQLFTKGSTSSQSPFQDSDFLSKQSARNTKTKYFSSFPKEQERKEAAVSSKSREEKREKSSDVEDSKEEESSKLKGRCKKSTKSRDRKRRTSELDASADDDSKLKEKRRKDVVESGGGGGDDEGKPRKDTESEKPDEKCKNVTEHKRKKKPEENLKSPDTKRRKFAEHKEKDFIACQSKKERKDREEQ